MRLFIPLCLLISLVSFAGDAPKSSWSTSGVQVKVDRLSNGIAVTLNKDKDHVPKSVGIIFIDQNGKRTALELKAIEPHPGQGVNPGLSQTQFAGTLSPAARSFTGFELRIPFHSEKPTIIRSEDLN